MRKLSTSASQISDSPSLSKTQDCACRNRVSPSVFMTYGTRLCLLRVRTCTSFLNSCRRRRTIKVVFVKVLYLIPYLRQKQKVVSAWSQYLSSDFLSEIQLRSCRSESWISRLIYTVKHKGLCLTEVSISHFIYVKNTRSCLSEFCISHVFMSVKDISLCLPEISISCLIYVKDTRPCLSEMYLPSR